MWDHGDIQSKWSPSQQLSNDVSYLGLPDTSLISTWLSIWGLRWISFTWGCPIMVIFNKNWSPGQELPSDVSYVGSSDFFHKLYMFKVGSLGQYNFTSGCGIMVTFRINDLRINSFPMMFHILVFLKLFKPLHD